MQYMNNKVLLTQASSLKEITVAKYTDFSVQLQYMN